MDRPRSRTAVSICLAQGHPVYGPEQRKLFIYHKEASTIPLYHPFFWRGWIEYGSGSVGDDAPHSMNVIFWALGLGAPSAVDIVETSGVTKEMYPHSEVLRWSGLNEVSTRR